MNIGKHYDVTLWIDAQEEDEENKGRYINHGKETANLDLYLFWDSEKPEAWLRANRNIKANEELLFDYGENNRRTIESFSFF